MMSTETIVELAALALAVWATLLSIPRPPQLAWERLFKVGLSVITAGEVQAEHGNTGADARSAWAERVLGVVAWNPAARLAMGKLADPRLDDVPVPALDGERALVEALARLPDPVARFQRIYVDDPHVQEELLGDPAALGDDHDPARILGPDAGWDGVAGWTEGLQAVLARRLADVVFVLDGLEPALVAEITAAWPGLRAVQLPAAGADPTGSEAVEVLLDAVEGALQRDSDRVVQLAGGQGVQRTLAALVEGGGLRDRCLAVLSLGGQLKTPEFRPWLDQHFDNESLDTELKRSVPYLHVIDVDPADPLASDWDRQRFPQPPPLPSGRAAVDVVDLGPVHLSGLHPRVLARGILLLLALRIAA